jgi:serine/threonine protein kinase
MDTEPVLRHFRNERQILATLDHPNIARLFDGGATEGGLPHFIMECVDGLPIDQYCDQRALSIPERLKLFRDVCGAVSYAHRHDVVHRDIKPSNVLVTTEGTPKLLDFGIAKALQQRDGTEATATMTLLRPMTPEYASPEQVRGEGATPASDIYSLGVVLYQLLTGQKPYRLKTRTCEEISRAILEQEPTRPSTVVQERDPRSGNRDSADSRVTNYDSRALRGDLDNIVLMALRKEPERRYQSVEDLSEDIRRHLERRPVLARKDTIVYWGGKFVRRNPVPIGAASVCLLLLLAVVWLARDRIVISETSAPQKSIAVLPFQNLSSDPGNAYFADGIQEEILTRLSKIADLKIISRTSTQHFKNSPEPLPQIAQQLRVAHILEGTVQKSADQLRVNVQLINAQNDSHLWAEKYDRKLSDIFAVETEIATKIADTLRAKLTGPEQRAVAVRPTENTRAYELYLRGEHLWTQRTDTALLKAIDYFNQAVSLDPNYARAYAGIADCYLALPFFSKLNPAECRQKAKLAAHKALEIDGDLAAAHVSIAILEATELKLTEAKREFLRAIDLDPNYADA